MAKIIVQHHVANYERWHPVFSEHEESVRRHHGGRGHTVYRATDDPNMVVIVTEFADVDGARNFMADPSLKEAMAGAGVDSTPQVWLVDEAETMRY